MPNPASILVLARNGLRRASLYSSEILQESHFNVTAFEFGDRLRPPPSRISFSLLRYSYLRSLRFRVVFRRFMLLMVFLRLARRFLAQGRPQLIIAHGWEEQLLAYGCKLFFRIPYYRYCHYPEKTSALDQKRWWVNRSFQNCSRFIFSNERWEKLYRKQFPLSSPSSIVYGCERRGLPRTGPFDIRRRYDLSNNTLLLVYAGKLCIPAALEEALCALRSVADWAWFLPEIDETKNGRRLKRLAEKLLIADRVFFLGGTSTDRQQILQNCDLSYCVFYPPKASSRSRRIMDATVMESIASGLPILSYSGAIGPTGKGRELGLQIRELTPLAISQALSYGSQHPNELKQTARRVQALYSKKLNYEAQFRPLLAHFQAPRV